MNGPNPTTEPEAPETTRPSDPPPRRPHPSSMSERLGWLHAWLSRFAFAFVHVDPEAVDRVRRLGERGSVVYVMRQRSVADYLLVNSVFLRTGMPLPQFVNGVAIGWFRSIRWIARRIVQRIASGQIFRYEQRSREADHAAARRLVSASRPILLFLRARRAPLSALWRGGLGEDVRVGEPYLEDVLRLGREQPAFVVPVAVFRGRGYRRRSSRLALPIYSMQEQPSEAKKLVTFLFNRHDLSFTVGQEIPVRAFVERYGQGADATRRLVRALRIFLYREERVVWGPRLLPKARVREIVLDGREMGETIARLAAERGQTVETVRREARSNFDEMAANFNGTYFTTLAYVFRKVWDRTFRGVETSGLHRVAERMREHPVVLVPCHRSHFDYLVLSYIFHSEFLSPPHIAAGINMAFFPMGMLFRGAGAFFIRRTFEGNELYKAVFRAYLTYLIREGYTQEFFIEGGRSRTGKILTPKLGMLSAIVNAFVHGARRDLYLVPVSITYERLVEEEAYKRELLGGEKEAESFGALLRARSVLSTNYGRAHVDFAEPISLEALLGERKERFARTDGDPAIEEEKRRFVLKLGFRLLEEVNRVSVLAPSSIAATVLLANAHPAIRQADFLRAAEFVLEHAAGMGARFAPSLDAERGTFADTLGAFARSGLVVVLADADGQILHVPDDKRLNLDFHKNNSIHLFVVLSLVASSLDHGVAEPAVREDVEWWLDCLRNEFVLPEREAMAAQIDALLARFRDRGRDSSASLVRLAAAILQNFREAYWIAAKAVLGLSAEGIAEKALVEEMIRLYRVNCLLGVLKKPEGNTTVTLRNAIVRFRELGHLASEQRGKGGRERWVVRGPRFEELARVERRMLARL